MIEAELLGGWAGWSLRGLEVVDGWGGVWLCSDAAVAGRLRREGGPAVMQSAARGRALSIFLSL